MSISFETRHMNNFGSFMRRISKNCYPRICSAKIHSDIKDVWSGIKTKRVIGRIISDSSLTFTSKEFGEFLTEKSKTNGQVEKVNRSLIWAVVTSIETKVRWEAARHCSVELIFSYWSRILTAELGEGEDELASERGREDRPQSECVKTALVPKQTLGD